MNMGYSACGLGIETSQLLQVFETRGRTLLLGFFNQDTGRSVEIYLETGISKAAVL